MPYYQCKGVGKALIEEELSRLSDINAKGFCLVGRPDYYKQSDFKSATDLVYKGVPQEVLFVLSFDGNIPRGEVTFRIAFDAIG